MPIIKDIVTIPGQTVLYNEDNGGITIDYSAVLERIAVGLETIANNSTTIANNSTASNTNSTTIANNSTTIANNSTTIANNSTTIANNSTTIANNSTTIADKQALIETYQKKLKELGESTGIHVVGPYDWLGLINVYRELIEQGKISDTQGNVGPAEISEAITKVNTYIAKIQQFPTGF